VAADEQIERSAVPATEPLRELVIGVDHRHGGRPLEQRQSGGERLH
jgi:hypothetical protein